MQKKRHPKQSEGISGTRARCKKSLHSLRKAVVSHQALAATVQHLEPRYVVGVGRFAAQRAAAALDSDSTIIGTAPHPSPANPAANRGWAPLFENALAEIGVETLARGSRR